MATIIVGSYMVRYPLGGNLSWALQYLTGLKDLGHDVYCVEKYVHENSCYDPVMQQMSNDCSYGIKTVSQLLARFGLAEKWCFVGHGEEYYGLTKNAISDLFNRADLFIENGSHGVWKEELENSKAIRAYIDVDPAFTQINWYHKLNAGKSLPEFDFYFTNGMNIGQPGNILPTLGIDWKYIFNPVNFQLFPRSEPSPESPYSTIMNWKSYIEDAKYKGVTYGHKDMEFEKFSDLPKHVEVPLEVAITSTPPGKEKELLQLGWRVANAQEVTFTYDLFMDYISHCRGEFSVVKNMYAATCSGWLSDKSAAFMASGRPVVLQETGFSKYLPVGDGLFAVNNMIEAKEAIEKIESNYQWHADKAYELARENLDTDKVLRKFLNDTGI